MQALFIRLCHEDVFFSQERAIIALALHSFAAGGSKLTEQTLQAIDFKSSNHMTFAENLFWKPSDQVTMGI